MHDILRERLMRKIETLPEEQVYQTLDYIEFLESKYATDAGEETSGLRRFAEAVEDKLRKKSMSPAKLREAFQLLSAADRVLSNVSSAGRKLMEELAPASDGDSATGDRPAVGEDSAKGDLPAVEEDSAEADLPVGDEDSPEGDLPTVEEDSPEGDRPAVEEDSAEADRPAVDEVSVEGELPAADELRPEG